ncbi:MAG: adenosine kinase [bacterium]|nr:adenosine kinase [bacterium]
MKKILGIGNALVDVLLKVADDRLLSGFDLEKGSMTLVNRDMMNRVLETAVTADARKSSGGSVANTIHGLGMLGAPAGYIGKIGRDDYGEFFSSYMEQNNVNVSLFNGKNETGKSIVLITEDSERTFATFLGAAVELDKDDLHIGLFRGYDYFHLEGYLVQNHDLVQAAVELAKEAGTKCAIDLASFNVVEANLDFLTGIVENYIDIVFANEEEAKAFTGKSTPMEALDAIAEKCEIAIVKIGKDGSLIKSGTETCRIPPIKVKAIDTTGAGDLFASGFFYGLSAGHPMEVCGKIGSITSGNIVEVIGAKMDDRKWQEVFRMVKEVEQAIS